MADAIMKMSRGEMNIGDSVGRAYTIGLGDDGREGTDGRGLIYKNSEYVTC